MQLQIKKISISLLFCLIFIVSFSSNVFGLTAIYDGKETGLTKKNGIYTLDTSASTDIEPLYSAVADYQCKLFQDWQQYETGTTEGEGEEVNSTVNDGNIIIRIDASYSPNVEDGREDFPMTSDDLINLLESTDEEELSKYANVEFTISFNAGNNKKSWTVFTENMYGITSYRHTIDKRTGNVQHIANESSFSKSTLSKEVKCGTCDKSFGTRASKNNIDEKLIPSKKVEASVAKATIEVLKNLKGASKTGLIAGAAGRGYNVGTVYSEKQQPLSTIMTNENGYYDFNEKAKSLSTSFDYYMHPLLGLCDFISIGIDFNEGDANTAEKRYVPRTVEEWTRFIEEQNINFISGYSVIFNNDFIAFDNSLIDNAVNSKGLKKVTDKNSIKFINGVGKVEGIGTSEEPGKVLNYVLRIAYPNSFKKTGNNYKLNATTLKLDPLYRFNIATGEVFEGVEGTLTDNSAITDTNSLSLPRTQVFLFNQINETGTPLGIVLIGEFHEAVVDTSSSQKDDNLLFATGRKIGLSAGYSSLMKLNEENKELVYVQSILDGERGYAPRNIAFPCNDEEIRIIENNSTVHPQAVVEGLETFMQLPVLSNDDLLNELKKKENHYNIDYEPTYIKFNIMLTEIVNKNGIGEDQSLTPEEIEKFGMSTWRFVIIRNNKYINDSNLKSWLRSDSAKSLAYVDAETLLDKIEGSFLADLEEITYEDWNKMKEIEKELNSNKDAWLVRAFNVLSLCFGVFLIIFAILLLLAYWFDIFNTFADFSILQFISFGNLYSVEDKELIPYTGVENGNVKYVTFIDVLILAFICVVLGILFINVDFMVEKILFIYNYIMRLLGGV